MVGRLPRPRLGCFRIKMSEYLRVKQSEVSLTDEDEAFDGELDVRALAN
jgi:hypothetical protein